MASRRCRWKTWGHVFGHDPSDRLAVVEKTSRRLDRAHHRTSAERGEGISRPKIQRVIVIDTSLLAMAQNIRNASLPGFAEGASRSLRGDARAYGPLVFHAASPKKNVKIRRTVTPFTHALIE